MLGFSVMRTLFIVVLLFASTAFAAWRDVGRVTSARLSRTNGITLQMSSGAKVLIEVYDLDVFRVRIAPSGRFETNISYAIDPSIERKMPVARVLQDRDSLTLQSPVGSSVVIDRSTLSVVFKDAAGTTIVASDRAEPTAFDQRTGEFRTSMLRTSEAETYYGFGEKAFAEMSRNGKFIVNWNTDTFSYPIGTDPIYQSIPFFIALQDGKSYGLFFHNTFRTWFDMGAKTPGRYSFGADGGELDYFVFTGGRDRSPKKVLSDYANLTGKAPMPPIWALGNQQSRWSYFPEARVREIADGFRKRKLPLDVLYLDIDYMDGYRVFTWDRKRFPDPPKLIGDLAKQGIKTVLMIDPGIKVDPAYAAYAEGRRQGVFVKNPEGTELNRNVWPQASAFPDFTDPRARKWFGDQYQGHLDEGVAGFWNDMNEPGVFLTETTQKPDVLHHPDKTFPYNTPHHGDGSGGTHRRYHNVYGMQMARSTFEGLRRLAPERRPFVLTRAGFAGIQRYSAVWTGDNYASWDHLALTIPMLTNMSVSGVSFVGADAGGFNDRPSGELYTRWLQAAVLTPFFRSHSVGWVGNKEPWEFGDEYTDINRSVIEMRYKFLPYLYSLFREHERTGEPIMRPLWYEYPSDTKTYLIADQFMLGRDLVVAPIVKEGTRSRRIYLPSGAWVNWWTGERLEGAREHIIEAPIDRLPLFGRAGAVIPMQGVMQHTGEMPGTKLNITVVAGVTAEKPETAVLYQDAGDGFGYRRNEWREIRIEHRPGVIAINTVGTFPGQQIGSIEAIGIAAKPKQMFADGREISFDYDEKTKRLKAAVPDGVRQVTVVR